MRSDKCTNTFCRSGQHIFHKNRLVTSENQFADMGGHQGYFLLLFFPGNLGPSPKTHTLVMLRYVLILGLNNIENETYWNCLYTPTILVDSHRMGFYNGSINSIEHGNMPLSICLGFGQTTNHNQPCSTRLGQETSKRLSLVPGISRWPTSLPWIFLGSGWVLFPDTEYKDAIFD